MGFNLNFGWGNQQEPLRIEKDVTGNIFYTMFSSDSAIGKRISDADKMKCVLSNPALLKVVALDCDIFSLGKINTLEENDFLYSIVRQPNPFQTWTQFNYDYQFWMHVYGTAILYNPGNASQLKETNPIIWLDPSKIHWETSIVDKLKNFLFSKKDIDDLMAHTITYNQGNGKSRKISLKEIVPFYDMTNAGQDNPMRGISRIDALYKVIKNSELALDSKAINLELSGKIMVSGKADPDNTAGLNMSEPEKLSIEQKLMSNKKVHAVKSMIDIKRFVENIANLKLDESFYNDYFMFGTMFNIPRDILEANLRGSTYENQEKATGRHVEYCLKPKGQMFTDWLERQYGFKDVKMSWSHLSFNQYAELERANTNKVRLENIKVARELNGLTDKEVTDLISNITL